jgi:hypothetical protein
MPSQAGALATRTPLPRLRQLLAGWMLGYNVPHTRRTYTRDPIGMDRSCAQLGPAGDNHGWGMPYCRGECPYSSRLPELEGARAEAGLGLPR